MAVIDTNKAYDFDAELMGGLPNFKSHSYSEINILGIEREGKLHSIFYYGINFVFVLMR